MSVCVCVTKRTPLKTCVSVCVSVCLCVCVSVCECRVLFRAPLKSCVSVHVSVCLPACLPACLPVCLSVCLSVCLCACGSEKEGTCIHPQSKKGERHVTAIHPRRLSPRCSTYRQTLGAHPANEQDERCPSHGSGFHQRRGVITTPYPPSLGTGAMALPPYAHTHVHTWRERDRERERERERERKRLVDRF